MKQINKVAVLGAGVMGATIAAHLANAGIQVLLLDIVPREPNEPKGCRSYHADRRCATASPPPDGTG